jgi:pyruvate dehydrogenase E1 component alpha subunit
MSDPDTYRGKDEVKEWQQRDAILLLGEHLQEQKILSDKDIERIDEEVMSQVDDTVRFAEESPEPDVKDLFRDVYARGAAS